MAWHRAERQNPDRERMKRYAIEEFDHFEGHARGAIDGAPKPQVLKNTPNAAARIPFTNDLPASSDHREREQNDRREFRWPKLERDSCEGRRQQDEHDV